MKKLTRHQKFRLISGLTTFFVVISIILVNILTTHLTSRYPISVDLTSEKVFQLTEQSKDYISALPAPVEFTVLNSEEGFTAGGSYFTQAQKVLEQYTKQSDQINLKYVDLLKNPSLGSSYENAHVGDIIVSSGNRTQQLSAYDLFNVESTVYGNTITSSKAEQALTSAILGVTSDNQTKVGILTGHGELESPGLEALLTSNQFLLSQISPVTEPIPQDMDILFLIAPTSDFDEPILASLNKFLDDPNKTLFYFADASSPPLPNLDAFLAEWGIQIGVGTIFETDANKLVNFNPYFSVTPIYEDPLSTTMLSPSVPLTLPFSHPVSALFTQSFGVYTTPLLFSSDSSFVMPDTLTQEEVESWQPSPEDPRGPFPQAVLSQKVFDSQEPSHLVAFGSSACLTDSLLTSGSFSNSDYFLSALNTLSHRENVVSIQPKSLGGKELGLTTGQAVTLGVFAMVVVPLFVLSLGFCVCVSRSMSSEKPIRSIFSALSKSKPDN